TLAGDARIRGRAADLSVDAALSVPEGAVDGLRFSAGSARLLVDRGGIRVRRGRVTVGSTRTSFAASYSGAGTAFRLNAPRADLADFNDLFDAGDTLGGRGRVDFRFDERAKTTRTSADISIAGLRYRLFNLGDSRAVWNSSGRNVRGSVAFGGASGRLAASGTLVLPQGASRDRVLLRSRFDGTAELQGLDLGVWLPALGYQLPVGGRVDARATIAGPLSDPAVSTTASLRDGSIGKFPVDRLSVVATSTLNRTTLRDLRIDLPSITVVGSGAFGLSDRSPVALSLRAQSADLATLSTRLFGSPYPVTGTADLDLTVDGTRARPRIAGRLDVRSASLHGVALPQARAAFSVRGRDVVLSDAQVRFATGDVTLDGSVPFEIDPFSLGPPQARVALAFAASDVELADFAPLLPAGSQLRGRVDGNVTIGGTAGAPQLGGRLTLGGGTLQSPFETIPLADVSALLAFAGKSVRLDSLHATAGGGVLDASGSARFDDLVHPGAADGYDFVARAEKLRLDLPAYGSGDIDGTLSLSRVAGGAPSVAGDLRLSDGTIPFSALLLAGGGGGGFDAGAVATSDSAARIRPKGVAFNLDVSAVRNVRVRSANVDIGARGDLHIGGSLDAPSLAGAFTSTGGTITYFNTVFRLVDGTVTFEPDLGVIPTLDARAVTHVIDPDPNEVRNLSGSADVTLALTGPVTNLSIGLTSNPSYERQQILGLLLSAPALGATNLFGENRDQATLYGSNVANVPAGTTPAVRSTAGELSVAQEAFGLANAQFTRTLLAPIETSFAQAVGLSNFNVNVDYTGNVGVSARKVLGKSVNAVYGSTFGYPYRQTFGFELKPNEVTAAQVTVFETLGNNGLNSLTPISVLGSSSNPRLSATQPSAGTAGFSLSLQRLF
ncbi:MAG: translocation/assembly module TamB domain-containing protein, partial [Candidatus Eremiobacteraeota bacterium]|nr:translocation/assembly module TamB domain-containing protein [Candidatus Eremiobacteraeota bacterium]